MNSEFNPDRPADMGPLYRAEAWRRLSEEQFDIVVIGGGVVGVGAALDAATRGLRVALVEARDIASGTSSRSSKMFHGGLRYLEQLEFGLVREALAERELSLRLLAPHLVKPLPFLYPLTRRVWERPYVAAGIFLYDRMGGAKSVPGQRHVTRSGALRVAPALKRDSLIGGIRYYDTVVDDARHSLTVARTAANYGAVIRTSTQVVGFLREADRVMGVRVRDSETGDTAEVARTASSMPPGSGPMKCRHCPINAATSGCAPPRVYTSSFPGTGSSVKRRSSCVPRNRCCSSSRGRRTGSSAPPTPTGISTSRIRPLPGPTSTTSSIGSTRCW